MSLTAADFFNYGRVPAQIAALHAHFAAQPLDVSDLRDTQNHQYVDLVMEGGGVLGISLLGYLYALESIGIRFLSIAGTSAGSIVALLLAAAGQPHEAKALKLTDALANMPAAEFVDGDHDAKNFIRWLMEDAGNLFSPGLSLAKVEAWGRMLLALPQVRDNFERDMGLCPGKKFEDWVRAKLGEFNVRSLSELMRCMQPMPGTITNRRSGEAYTSPGAICLIAADITTETKVKFPQHASLYFAESDPDPARMVRCSMSVPLFFHPAAFDIPVTPVALEAWNRQVPDAAMRAQRTQSAWPPKRCLLVDGGVMSNFPIDAFHNYRMIPRRPTFGAKLQVDSPVTEIASAGGLFLQTFNAARHCRDNDFIQDNPDFSQLVADIDTGEHNWLNFGLSDEAKLDLFARGVETAIEFVKGFDWEHYRTVREQMMQVQQVREARLASA